MRGKELFRGVRSLVDELFQTSICIPNVKLEDRAIDKSNALSISRCLAGCSFTNTRRLYLTHHSEHCNLMLTDNHVLGVGIHLNPTEDEKVDCFVSVWNLKNIKTFHHISSSSNICSSFKGLLENLSSKNLNMDNLDDMNPIYKTNIEEYAEKLFQKEYKMLLITSSGEILTKMPPTIEGETPFILPGSFNPLHEGHVGMLEKTAKWDNPNSSIFFELSVHNADKPPLPVNIMLDRAAQFAGKYNIILSAEPFFVDKAKLYHPASFIVGYDTAKRILDPKYYNNSTDEMINQLSTFVNYKCDFKVCGRNIDGIWMSTLAVSNLKFLLKGILI